MSDFQPKPFVFVLMPFSKDFDDVYQLGIKKACEQAGTYAERVDEQIYDGSMLQRIYNQISKADIVVADMTGKNPNVFYETGYAHALGKPVILLTQNTDDIPFDLKHHHHIVYNGRIVDLLGELEKRVRYFVANPMKEGSALQRDLELVVNRVRLANSDRNLITGRSGYHSVELDIGLHNSIGRVIQVVECQVGLIAPSFYIDFHDSGRRRIQRFEESTDTTLFLDDRVLEILPGSWESVQFHIHSSYKIELPIPCRMDFSVRIFRKCGVEDHPFAVEFLQP